MEGGRWGGFGKRDPSRPERGTGIGPCHHDTCRVAPRSPGVLETREEPPPRSLLVRQTLRLRGSFAMQAENRSMTPHPKFSTSLVPCTCLYRGCGLRALGGGRDGAQEKADKPTASTTRTAQLRGNQSACGFSFVVPRPPLMEATGGYGRR
ncbi:hypothetical protein NL676_004264 [Syzygium grande]|nr:hypothetical protein NL676_004264 [Syzygium grande]